MIQPWISTTMPAITRIAAMIHTRCGRLTPVTDESSPGAPYPCRDRCRLSCCRRLSSSHAIRDSGSAASGQHGERLCAGTSFQRVDGDPPFRYPKSAPGRPRRARAARDVAPSAEPSLHHVDVNGVDFAYLRSAPARSPCASTASPTARHVAAPPAPAGRCRYRAVAPFQRGLRPDRGAGRRARPDRRPRARRDRAPRCARRRRGRGDHRPRLGAPGDVGRGRPCTRPLAARSSVWPCRPASAMGAALLTNRTQLKRRWYMFFFQHPLADLVVAGRRPGLRRHAVGRTGRRASTAAMSSRAPRTALRGPANLAAALGYYRAGPVRRAVDPPSPTCKQRRTRSRPQPTCTCTAPTTAGSARGRRLRTAEAGDHVEFAFVAGYRPLPPP